MISKRRASDDDESPLRVVLSHPVYYDYANESLGLVNQSSDRHIKEDKESFPVKLHAMLEASEADGFASIIKWMPHGRAFKINDKIRLEKEVLPRYFSSQSKYGSFQRQLNMYGFLRVTRPCRDQKAYYHERFLRGRPAMAANLPRCRSFTNSVRRTYDPLSEPDFEKMPPVFGQDSQVATAPRTSNATEPVVHPPVMSFNTDKMQLQSPSQSVEDSSRALLEAMSAIAQSLGTSTSPPVHANRTGDLFALSQLQPMVFPSSNSTALVPSVPCNVMNYPQQGGMCKVVSNPQATLQGCHMEPVPMPSSNATWPAAYPLQGVVGALSLLPTEPPAAHGGLLDPDVANDVIDLFSMKRSMSSRTDSPEQPNQVVSSDKSISETTSESEECDPLDADTTHWDSTIGSFTNSTAWLESVEMESFWDLP